MTRTNREVYTIFSRLFSSIGCLQRFGSFGFWDPRIGKWSHRGIIGLVVEYIVAIDVTRVRFPDDALLECWCVMDDFGGKRWNTTVISRDSSVGRASD